MSRGRPVFSPPCIINLSNLNHQLSFQHFLGLLFLADSYSWRVRGNRMMTQDNGSTDQNDSACGMGWIAKHGVRAQLNLTGARERQQRWGAGRMEAKAGEKRWLGLTVRTWAGGPGAPIRFCRARLTPRGLRRAGPLCLRSFAVQAVEAVCSGVGQEELGGVTARAQVDTGP